MDSADKGEMSNHASRCSAVGFWTTNQPPPIPPQRAGDTTVDLAEALRLSLEQVRGERDRIERARSDEW